jgi:hypothetical protein
MRKLVSVLGIALMFAAASAGAEEPAAEGGGDSPVAEVKEETQEAAQEAGMKGAEPAGGAKYGPAGCGLGSMIFDPDSGFTQVLAATTNGSSANQTFGITSGTSNCDTGPGSSDSAKVFVESNRAALAKDIARGKGETLASLSDLAGCQNDKLVGKKLQKNFKKIFPNAKVTDQQVSEKVVAVLKSDASLSCQNVI